ncbi:c2h2 finger domain containing protein [Niveomyces insectorum RCEF 264]|uniref:C2h2 finger domain containing protein n=1 Tax=Niveomyces insectorum RCEF 264 TaxID=1081102 RepID=A0A167RFJ1_9HYPO|nr:c2h2 finger domain containing protein [Niveomyces insectorum RCEF 264]
MASSKELQQPSRPLTHRPSLSNASNGTSAIALNAPNGFSNRQSHSRTGSHSIIGAALNPNHRVSRRKSMTSPGATNVAAMAALIQEADATPGSGLAIGARRSTMSKVGAGAVSSSLGGFPAGTGALAAAMAHTGTNGTLGSLSLPSPPASLPRKFVTADGSAIDDDPNDMSDGEIDPAGLSEANALAFENARIRRASDGQPLAKEGRRSSRMELHCDKCGKGYKHSSCLTKHLWEHTPEWSLTSKLLISKHQQVQLLEAASVLVAMNHKPGDSDAEGNAGVNTDVHTIAPAAAAADVTTPPDSARDFASDHDSPSPAASRYSDQSDDRSSADTTPPPPVQMENAMSIDETKTNPQVGNTSPPPPSTSDYRAFSQRLGLGGGATAEGFSRSYQSALPADAGGKIDFNHRRLLSRDNVRPPSSGRNATGQEDNELAAAVELLSCSFNSAAGDASSAKIGSIRGLGQDVPPVPPVPAQYLGQSATPLGDTSFINSFPSRAPESFTRGERRSKMSSLADDVKMEDSGESFAGDDDEDRRSRARSDDDDDGVFGRMEE